MFAGARGLVSFLGEEQGRKSDLRHFRNYYCANSAETRPAFPVLKQARAGDARFAVEFFLWIALALLRKNL